MAESTSGVQTTFDKGNPLSLSVQDVFVLEEMRNESVRTLHLSQEREGELSRYLEANPFNTYEAVMTFDADHSSIDGLSQEQKDILMGEPASTELASSGDITIPASTTTPKTLPSDSKKTILRMIEIPTDSATYTLVECYHPNRRIKTFSVAADTYTAYDQHVFSTKEDYVKHYLKQGGSGGKWSGWHRVDS